MQSSLNWALENNNLNALIFSDVEILIVYHPGDNVMVLMIAMTCQMKKAVQVA